MATIPLSGTHIRLMSGVPFNNDYKNTRWFDSKTQQENYFASKRIVFEKEESNFQRIEGRSYFDASVNADKIMLVNYLMFRNAEYTNKWFYGFITKVEWQSKSVTRIFFEIDVLQTWRFEMNFKPSFVVREHRPLWNADGSPVINTLDEGLDYGTDYDVKRTIQYVPNGGYKWLVVVSKTSLVGNFNDIRASVIGTPQPLHYYIVPYKDDNTTPNVYIEKEELGGILAPPTELLKILYENEGTANDIVSIYVTDWTGVECSYDSDTNVMTFPNNDNELDYVSTPEGSLIRVNTVPRFSPVYHVIDEDKYTGYEKPEESKLLMFPYCVLTLCDFKGNQVDLKLEYIDEQRLFINYNGSLGTSNKTTVTLPSYNRAVNDGQAGKTALENALINNDPSDIAVLTDMLSAYMQGNRNSIANQKSAINWNGLLSGIGATMAGNALGVGQSLSNSIHGIQGLEAKQKDINNVPPQLSKMGSNTAYDYGHGYNGVFFLKKQIKPEYQQKLRDFFNMFGYKTNEVKIPNFHTRRYWNYVETKTCNITGEFNNEDLAELKNIFDTGITLWHTDDVGNYSLNNGVI